MTVRPTQEPVSRSTPERPATALQLALVLLLGLGCYGSSFSIPFYFDDFSAIVNNPDVTGGRSVLDLLLHGGPRRIADISFALNHSLGGLHPAGYHAVNLAIHLAAALALYALTVSTLDAMETGEPARGQDHHPAAAVSGRFIPLAAALLFVCHPIQTQAVSYIVQRQTSLAALFYLLALLAFIRGRMLLERDGTGGRVFLWGVALTVLALSAFHTKQSTFSLPLMITLLELGLFGGRLFKRHLALTGAAAASLIAAMLLPAALNGSLPAILSDLHRSTAEDLFIARGTYFLTQLRVVVTYLRLLLLPVHQNLDYDYPLYTSPLQPAIIGSLCLHAVLLSAAALLYRHSRSRTARAGDSQRVMLRLMALGIAWLYVALAVESSFIPITDVIMEHRLYLPSAGFCIALAALTRLICLKCGPSARLQWSALAALCLVFSLMTHARNRLWSDELRFWQDAAAKSPAKGRVLSNLGRAYLNSGRPAEAVPLFVSALDRNPRLNGAWLLLGRALQGVGRYQGRFSSGTEYLTPAGQVDFRYLSRYDSAKFNTMGLACEFSGRPEAAMTWYRLSLQMDPDSALAWYNLGLLAAQYGDRARTDEALARLRHLQPGLAQRLAARLDQPGNGSLFR